MAPELAISFLPDSSAPPITVLDPMCGAGTVLAAAAEIGHSGIGFDLDPLAVSMSRVATSEIDLAALAAVGKRVVDRANRLRSVVYPWTEGETTVFAEFWFGSTQLVQLAHLSRAISSIEDDPIKNALNVAMSRMIVTKSPRASLAADTAHSRPHKVSLESDFDIFNGFETSLTTLCKLLQKRKITTPATVELGDARNLTSVRNGEVDLVITSPPYLNAIDYMRGHRLALIWQGFDITELRKIRSNSIGAERRIDGPADARIFLLLEQVLRNVKNPDELPNASIARYAQDLTSLSSELKRVVKKGGRVIAVVGNSTIRGNFIANDQIFEEAMSLHGFNLTDRFERELPQNRRYLPISKSAHASSLNKRMRSEVVLSLENVQAA